MRRIASFPPVPWFPHSLRARHAHIRDIACMESKHTCVFRARAACMESKHICVFRARALAREQKTQICLPHACAT